VLAVTDATPSNGPEHLELFRLANLPQRVTVMPGVHRLDEMEAAGYPPGWAEGRLAVGHAKVMAAAEEVPGLIARAHARGWPAAVHVDDVDMAEAVIVGFAESPAVAGTPDRVEHLSLSLPGQVARLGSLRRPPIVVTQPSFLRHRAHKYRNRLSTVEQSWLYRVRSLLDVGIEVRFSSDAPVVPCDPAEWIDAAVDRQGLADDEAVDEATARACCELPAARLR
jgi:predicted amidohydrolase YtcJ